MVIANAPTLRPAGRSGRASYQAARRRKLTVDQIAVIQAGGHSRSLRSLATEFEVSHETIRHVR